jgi:hypothetical protein
MKRNTVARLHETDESENDTSESDTVSVSLFSPQIPAKKSKQCDSVSGLKKERVDATWSAIRGLTREFLMLLMPLFFFSVKRLLCSIILVLGLSLGELPNFFVLDFLRQTSISCILSLL